MEGAWASYPSTPWSSVKEASDRPTPPGMLFASSAPPSGPTLIPHILEANIDLFHHLLHHQKMRSTSAKLVAVAALATGAQAAVVEHWWNITWTDANLDGVSFSLEPRETLI